MDSRANSGQKPEAQGDAACCGEHVLEEYATGRIVSGPARIHIEGCAACTDKASELRAEAEMMAKMLNCAHGAPRGECPAEEQCAEYLDGGPSGAERAKLEEHFATCPDCLHKLVHLHRQVRDATNADRDCPAENMLGGVQIVDQIPAGETVDFDEHQAEIQAAEHRKQALSTDFKNGEDDEERKRRTLSGRS